MQRDADRVLSNIEKEFIVQALKEERRIDGRGSYEMREPKFQFSLDDSSCTVLLGQTRVMTVISASLEAPYPDRPNEGTIRFNVEFSPMASPAFEAGRPGEEAIEVARLIERGLRESRAVDQEALVVVSGRKVWHLRVDIHVLDHQGNLVDACGICALAALMAFRRPDVTVGEDGQAVTVHSPEVREPLPLSIHHLPLPVSFAFFEDGGLLVVDPGLKEEAASSGGLTLTLNPHGELCAVQKARGVGLPPAEIMRCIHIAAQKVEDVTSKMKKALEAHAVARVQARIRRRPPPSAEPSQQQQQRAEHAAEQAELPQPVQDLLRRARAMEESEGDADMAGSDADDMADVGGGGEVMGDGEEREVPGEDGMEGSREKEGSAEGAGGSEVPQDGSLLSSQQQPTNQQLSSQERRKEKRKRRASQLNGGSGTQQLQGDTEGDQFELIASMIAGAGGKGQQANRDSSAGLEGAVKQGASSKQRIPSGGKREKGGRS